MVQIGEVKVAVHLLVDIVAVGVVVEHVLNLVLIIGVVEIVEIFDNLFIPC